MSDVLPISDFSTERLPAAEQFAAWRAGNQVLFDVLPPDGVPPAAFPGRARTYHLGRLLIGETSFSAQRYTRSEERLGRDGMDMFLVRLHLSGGHVGNNGARSVEANAGDIDVIDMLQPLDYVARASTIIVLGIPRAILLASLPEASALHGMVLRGETALGALLADYFQSLMTRLPAMTIAEAESVATATVAMVTACLRPAHQQIMGRGAGAMLAAELKSHIEIHIQSRELTAAALCKQFRLSRASLYRLFQPMGGLQRYIRDRRLVRAFMALADPAQQDRSVGEIAFEWGFTSDAHFSRVFRETFNCTPGQARKLRQLMREPGASALSPPDQEPEFAEWLRRLGARDR